MVVDDNWNALYFSRSVIPYLRGIPENEWPARNTYYKHIGLYAFRASVLEAVTRLPQAPLEQAESLEQLRWLSAGYCIKVGVTDVETKFSVVEEIKNVYDVLKLLLTEERFNVLDRELLAGNEVVYNFMTNKLSFVRTKDDKEMNEFFSKEMNIGAIKRRLEDSEEKDKYFLK